MNPPPRFLCDEMLGRLCRYLRAAGYDTVLANNGNQDRDLLQQCHEEGRYFLTQDRLVREHRAARGIALIPAGDYQPNFYKDEPASRAVIIARSSDDWAFRYASDHLDGWRFGVATDLSGEQKSYGMMFTERGRISASKSPA